MGGMLVSLVLPWGVHISDGVLTVPWLAGSFALSGLLVLLAAYRVRDEEIPRIALLGAAFFVASLIHVRLGPTSVHLLLNGLVGVVLGRRAPLAILIGLALQAALLGHGGFSTLGVNTCVLTLPALLAGWMFGSLLRLPRTFPKKRAFFWMLGCVIGMTSVLATLVLNAVVLFWGGAEDWHAIVWFVFYAHLPIVGLEGVIVGFTVSFLSRVKPEMLGVTWETSPKGRGTEPAPSANGEQVITRPPLPAPPPALLLVALTTLFDASLAQAHSPQADFTVLPGRQVRIEGWFDPGAQPMRKAKVQVFRAEKQLLVEGELDDEGRFVFPFREAEPLEVVISAGAGHRKAFVIPSEKLDQSHYSSAGAEPSSQKHSLNDAPLSLEQRSAWRERLKDALLGVTFLLALAAFILSWRNGRKLKSLQDGNGTESPRS